MIEAGWHDVCDFLVFVDTPLEQRLKRVAARGWTEKELRQREAAQLPLTEKAQKADHILHNSGSLDELDRQECVAAGRVENFLDPCIEMRAQAIPRDVCDDRIGQRAQGNVLDLNRIGGAGGKTDVIGSAGQHPNNGPADESRD